MARRSLPTVATSCEGAYRRQCSLPHVMSLAPAGMCWQDLGSRRMPMLKMLDGFFGDLGGGRSVSILRRSACRHAGEKYALEKGEGRAVNRKAQASHCSVVQLLYVL